MTGDLVELNWKSINYIKMWYMASNKMITRTHLVYEMPLMNGICNPYPFLTHLQLSNQRGG